MDERTNQTLKSRLSKFANENKDDWPDYLEQIAFSMRTQTQRTTKFTPFYLMFGRHPRTPLEVYYQARSQDESRGGAQICKMDLIQHEINFYSVLMQNTMLPCTKIVFTLC